MVGCRSELQSVAGSGLCPDAPIIAHRDGFVGARRFHLVNGYTVASTTEECHKSSGKFDRIVHDVMYKKNLHHLGRGEEQGNKKNQQRCHVA
jgi:hypothetical protein